MQRIEYKPYGEISRVHSTTFATSFGFAGAVQDGVSGLKDFEARSYDPSLGRFISVDPIVSDPLDLNELAIGQAVGGQFHIQKGTEYARALQNWLRANPNAPYRERLVAQSVLDDLRSALGGAP